jgi:hypothetical protein
MTAVPKKILCRATDEPHSLLLEGKHQVNYIQLINLHNTKKKRRYIIVSLSERKGNQAVRFKCVVDGSG